MSAIIEPVLRSLLRPVITTAERAPNKGVRSLSRKFWTDLLTSAADKTLLVAGDSTGNGYTEWVKRLADQMEPTLTAANRRIDFYLYNDTTKAYGLLALLGRTSSYGVMSDTFERADGALGTTSSGGQTWSANSWTISGGKAIPNATSSLLTAAGSLTGTSFKANIRLAIPNAGDARHYFLNGSGRYLMVVVRSTKGIEVYAHNGTTLSNIFTQANSALVAGSQYDLEIVKDGLNISVNMADMIVQVGTLTQAQEDALTGRQCYIMSVTSTSGHAWESYQVGDLIKPSKKLTIWNGSISGTGFTYHTTNIATICPSRPDLAIVSICHNESTDSPATYLTNYDAYVAALRSQAGGDPLPIVATVQNPEISPAVNRTYHNARCEALQTATAARGWDKIDVYSAFNSYAGGLAALIEPADGVHPSEPYGNPLWASTVSSHMGVP